MLYEGKKDISKGVEKMSKKVMVVLIVLLALASATMAYLAFEDDNKEKAYYSKISSETNKLTDKTKKIDDQIYVLKKEFDEKTTCKGNVELVFTELNPLLYTEIYPIMNEYQYPGILVLTPDQYPGKEDCLSIQQYNELINAGWQSCIGYFGDSIQEIADFKKRLDNNHLSYSPIIYFNRDTYQQGYDQELAAIGINTVIHHGEESLDIVSEVNRDEFCHLGAVSYRKSNAKEYMNRAIELGRNCIYTVGFSLKEESYNEKVLKAMLKTFHKYEDKDNLSITTIDNAYQYFISMQDEKVVLEEEMNNQINTLKNEKEELNEQIKEINDSYKEKDKDENN